MSESPRYSKKEVDLILRRALADQDDRDDRLSEEELAAAAKEVGIAPERLEQAIAATQRERDRLALRDEWHRRERARFRQGLVLWAVVSALCFGVDALTAGGWWFYWVMGPWGVATLLRGLRLGREPSDSELRTFERREKGRAWRRQLEERVEQSGHALELLVGQGVGMVLSHMDEVMERKLTEQQREHIGQERRPALHDGDAPDPATHDEDARTRRR